ncbi:MAG TPA: hypothetical protein DIC28_04185 [Aerococcus urinaeequi]|nr:hypothetical protein [Aerococcus urinaeequi]
MIKQDVSTDAQLNNDGRLWPYHTQCDANYSEADTCLPWRARLKRNVSGAAFGILYKILVVFKSIQYTLGLSVFES